MTVHYSATVRNAKANARETAIGTSPFLRYYSGTVPADTSASLGSAVLLLEIELPSDWLGNASAGAKALSGSWSGTVEADGAPSFYRIYASDGTTCHEQGAVPADATIDSPLILGRTVNVTSASFTEGNA